MTAREAILGRIGAALDRPKDSPSADANKPPAEVAARLQAWRRSTVPLVAGDMIETLLQNMQAVLMTVTRVDSPDECVAAVREYLVALGIDAESEGVVSVAPALSTFDWPAEYHAGPASGDELVGITPCIAAVAETGSVVTASGPLTPASLNFLPETHIIIVHESQVVRYVDDVFATIRSTDPLPRAINFVTGPSRTADIEQTLEIGAHGPRRMHVVLVAGTSKTA